MGAAVIRGQTLPILEFSFLDKINQFAKLSPEKECIHVVTYENNQLAAKGISYASLIHHSLSLANKIKSKTKEKDRVIIAIEHPIQFLIAFIATLAARCIAVPVPSADSFKSSKTIFNRNKNICTDCQPSLYIVDNQEAWVNMGFSTCEWILSDSLIQAHSDNHLGILPRVDLDEVAYLQYTSGSTDNPKGCVISHRNLATNLMAIIMSSDYQPTDSLITWLPLYHDMGLISLILPLYCDIKQYTLTPRQFITRPIIWLNSISKYRPTVMLGPPFGYHLVSQYTTDKQLKDIDLSNIRLAFMGAENVPLKVLKEFSRRFQTCGFNPKSFFPSYGMAECTLAATLPPPNRDYVIDTIDRSTLSQKNKALATTNNAQESVSFISVGQALPGHEVMIMNLLTGELCQEREVGEIVITGPSVIKAYFNRETLSLPLKTGDLGYIANNELFIVDRIKDLIIIAGQNYYPSDIETCLMEIPELDKSKVVCFAIIGKLGTEALQVVVESKPTDNATQERLAELIKKHVHRNFSIGDVTVRFIPRGSLERTSSGKIMRNVNKTLMQAAIEQSENNADLAIYG